MIATARLGRAATAVVASALVLALADPAGASPPPTDPTPGTVEASTATTDGATPPETPAPAGDETTAGSTADSTTDSTAAANAEPAPPGSDPVTDTEPGTDWTAEPLEPTEILTGGKSATSALAQTDPELLERNDATPVPVLIKLDYDSVATYQGDLEGLPATSPAVTGEELTGDTPAEQAYEEHIAEQEEAFEAELAEAVPEAEVGEPLRTVYGGVQAVVPANRIDEVLALDGVVAVQEDKLNQLLTDASPDFIGATSLYDDLGGDTQAGEGVIIGVLDSGTWPEHPSFQDQGNLEAPPPTLDGAPRACDFGDNPLTPEDDPFQCNNKLIGGRAFLDRYLSDPARADAEPFHSARDSNGHGTHTASTAAGNVLEQAEVFGVDRGPLGGIAPGAWVSVYKVCGIDGCYASDSAAAVERAILDGVDVINYSISGGDNPFTDPVELAFLDAYAAGVFVAASAGNEGPGAGTANHLSAWTTTVGASTQAREFQSTLTVTAASGATATFTGVTITGGAGPLPVVLSANAAPEYQDDLCANPAPAGSLEGLIVACKRGTNARVDKGYNVLQGGAAGMILYNPSLADVETDNHWLPTIHLADGTALVEFLTANPDATAEFTAGTPATGQADVMAAFSSRGPAGNFIKPDITAPGVQILAGHTPVPESEGTTGGPDGQYFQAIAGTSMSSPQIAGSAVLLRALHPDWTPMQLRSAMMLTSVTDVVKEDLTTPAGPFDMGAGRIDLRVAGNPGLTMDESAGNMLRLANDPEAAVHLNLPSIYAPTMPGRLETTRTFTNVTSRTQRYRVLASATDGASISVSPREFSVRPGQSRRIKIRIEAPSSGDQHFGEIRLVPKTSGRGRARTTLHLPVAFVARQGEISLASACTPDTIRVRDRSTCTVTATNTGFEDVTVDLTTRVSRELDITRVRGRGARERRDRVELRKVTLAGGIAATPSVDPGPTPGGFIPLGVTSIPLGDETVVNFNTPPFLYNGQVYTRIGIDTNGYAVVGGATLEDNNCCELPSGPDPARPNNLLAPFWTDLDGLQNPALGLRAATLSDTATGERWLVFEWAVVVQGTLDLRWFQLWIGLNGVQDISFTYAARPTDPNGQDFLVGAENEFGQGDVVAELPTTHLVVTSTDAVPGMSVSYTVQVRGERRGTGRVTTEMTGTDLPGGTTVVTSTVNVVKRR